MSRALTIPSAGDIELDWAQAFATEVQAALNSLDGAAVLTGTIPVASLAKPRTFFSVAFNRDASLTTTDRTGVFGYMIPLIDGSSQTVDYLGASVLFGDSATALAAQTGAEFDVKGIVSGVAAWTHSIDLRAANITGLGIPFDFPSGSVQTIAQGSYIRVDYKSVAAAVYPFTCLVLHFSVPPVSN